MLAKLDEVIMDFCGSPSPRTCLFLFFFFSRSIFPPLLSFFWFSRIQEAGNKWSLKEQEDKKKIKENWAECLLGRERKGLSLRVCVCSWSAPIFREKEGWSGWMLMNGPHQPPPLLQILSYPLARAGEERSGPLLGGWRERSQRKNSIQCHFSKTWWTGPFVWPYSDAVDRGRQRWLSAPTV